jgi:hypothetical protein
MQKLSSPIRLIDESFKIFFAKENIFYFISIYLILIPFQVFSYFQNSLESTPYAIIVVIVNILALIAYFLTSIAGILAVKRVIDGGQLNYKDTMASAWKNLWRYFLLSALLFLITLGGTILLIIPGIIFSIWFSFSGFVFIDQGLGIKASLSRSRQLFKGRFWSVYWRIIVFGIFFGLVTGLVFLLSLIPFGIGSSIYTLAGAFYIIPYYLLYKELDEKTE